MGEIVCDLREAPPRLLEDAGHPRRVRQAAADPVALGHRGLAALGWHPPVTGGGRGGDAAGPGEPLVHEHGAGAVLARRQRGPERSGAAPDDEDVGAELQWAARCCTFHRPILD
jgi:hypothetical protein